MNQRYTWRIDQTQVLTGDEIAVVLADPSGDGFVGIVDLNTVLGNWNAGTPPGAGASAAIPEPATITLLGIGAGVLLRRRIN